MSAVQAPPQPGVPQEAHRFLPLGRFGSYLLLGGIACVLATLGFAWLAKGIFADQFVAFDDGVITLLHHYWGDESNQLMFFFTSMGDPVVLGLFIGLSAAALWLKGRWIDASGLVLAAGGAGIVNQVLKVSFQRVRPDLFPGPFHLTSYSFPSGHAMGAIACYGMLAFVLVRVLQNRLLDVVVVFVAALIIFGVGLSRVFFGVHYPTDVLGGYLAGGAWLLMSIVVVEAAEWHARRRGASVQRTAAGGQNGQQPAAASNEDR